MEKTVDVDGIHIPTWVIRNLSRFGNCVIPHKLIKHYKLEDLENALHCRIRAVENTTTDDIIRRKYTYIGERQ